MKVPCAWFFTHYKEVYSLMSFSRQYLLMTIIQKNQESTHIFTIYIRQSCNNQQSDEKVCQNFKMRNLHIFITWFWSSLQHDQMPFGIFYLVILVWLHATLVVWLYSHHSHQHNLCEKAWNHLAFPCLPSDQASHEWSEIVSFQNDMISSAVGGDQSRSYREFSRLLFWLLEV